jgi:hypothetical protein
MIEEYIDAKIRNIGFQRETSLVFGLDWYYYAENWWIHGWGNYLPFHYGHDKYSYHNANAYKDHLDANKDPEDFMYMEPMWMGWNDYDFGGIFGVKIKDNLGVFAEGKYLFYWERPAYDIKLGVNYQFVGW